MLRTCAVSWCSESTAGYSTLCRQHKQIQRRHGSPTQAGVTSQQLRPFEALVDNRKTKNPNSEAWGLLEGRWGAVLDTSRVTLQRFAEGQPAQRAAIQAARHLCNVADNAAPWVVIRTALAMFIYIDQQPRQFTSDGAFDFQLVRRVLRLAPANAGSYWDNKENRLRKVYRDVPPLVIRTVAATLKAAFGAPGLMLAAKERTEAQLGADQHRRLGEALGDLQ